MDQKKKKQKVRHPFKIQAQLFLSASNLTNLDEFDDSDPFCLVSIRHDPNLPWESIG
jgi:hypothetical protein